MFRYSRDRSGEHPQAHLASYAGLLQADAYGGYGRLYAPERRPGPILEAACWAHARRPFFALADIEQNARRASARAGATTAFGETEDDPLAVLPAAPDNSFGSSRSGACEPQIGSCRKQLPASFHARE